MIKEYKHVGTSVQKCHKGDNVEYNGIKGTVTRVFGHLVKIEDVNGKTKWVKRKHIKIFDYYKDSIASHDEQIEHNQEVIDENKELHALASDAVRINRRGKWSVLKEAGAKSESQIQDKSLLKKFKKFCNDLNDAISMRNIATATIIRASHSTQSECSAKLNDIYGLAIAEKTLDCMG